MSRVISAGLLDKEIAVLKSNSNLSEQQIREMYQVFIEEFPSGRMNHIQFNDFYKNMTGSEDENGHLVGNVFGVFDKNGDGSIDFSEFVLAVGLTNKKDLDSTLELAFETLDTSRDGHVSFGELTKYIDLAERVSKEGELDDISAADIASYIFAEFGIDEDQKLNKQQFINGCKNNAKLNAMFGQQD